MEEIIEPKYLPFPTDQLRASLAKSFNNASGDSNESDDPRSKQVGVRYYTKSAHEYEKYKRNPELYKSISQSKRIRQIERDERLWTAATLMALQYSDNPGLNWSKLFSTCFGQVSQVEHFGSWEEAVGHEPVLLLEAPLPSPKKYSHWLRDHLHDRQLIPYVFDAARETREAKLEGFTHADAIVINKLNGFAVVFESKVLSDISVEVTFDCLRNQLARTVDVMLEEPEPRERSSDVLSLRRPELTYFALLTPRMFKQNPWSRLYGRTIREYQQEPEALGRDLPHRSDTDWKSVSRRLGWITWEDCNEVLPGACPWLND